TGAVTTCSQIPSIDVLYADVWTDPVVAGRPADVAFSYLYSDLSTPKPDNAHCVTWDALCRSTIHYPDDTMPPFHIQSLCDFPRLVMVAGVAVDHTCVSCHTPVGVAAAIQIPAGNLDLRAVASNDDPSVSTSYRDLLFPRNEQTLIMGVPTPTGVVLAPPITAGSSNASAGFFGVFDGRVTQPVDH